MSVLLALALLTSVPVQSGPVSTPPCRAAAGAILNPLSSSQPARQTFRSVLAADAIAPAKGGTFTTGAEAVTEALAPAGAEWRWEVVRTGVSADRNHGYTVGYIDEAREDGATASFKFLAYWVKDAEVWRIKAFRKVPAPAGQRPRPQGCLILHRPVPGDAAEQRAGLMAAEQQFSDDAQVIGIGPAFAKHGSVSSINLGQGPGLTEGAEAIGAEIASGNPPPLAWSSDDALVAPSGDLGLSWGVIRVVGGEGRFAFFTVWHRAGPDEPWRYIAE